MGVTIFRPGQRLVIPGARVMQTSASAASWIANGTSLATSLVAYWELDEASGSRADSKGSNTLTDNNTVTSGTGLVYSLAGTFAAANSEFLSIATNAALTMGDIDFWLAAWCKFATVNVGGQREIIAKDINTPAGGREYALEYDASGGQNKFTFFAGKPTDSLSIVRSVLPSPAVTGGWYLVVAWHNATANTVNISVNDGTVASTATGGALQTGGIAGVRIGSRDYASSPSYWDGNIGPVMVGKNYVPTAADITFLYNAGAGRA